VEREFLVPTVVPSSPLFMQYGEGKDEGYMYIMNEKYASV
jgi:hypothetical protein